MQTSAAYVTGFGQNFITVDGILTIAIIWPTLWVERNFDALAAAANEAGQICGEE